MARRKYRGKIIMGDNAKPIYPLWEGRVWWPSILKKMDVDERRAEWVPIQAPPHTSFYSESQYPIFAELLVGEERDMKKWPPHWDDDKQGREPAWFRQAVRDAEPVWYVNVYGDEEYALLFQTRPEALAAADQIAREYIASGQYASALVLGPGQTRRHRSAVVSAYRATGVEPHEYDYGGEGVEEMEAAWVMYDWLMARGLKDRAKGYAWAVPKRGRRR